MLSAANAADYVDRYVLAGNTENLEFQITPKVEVF